MSRTYTQIRQLTAQQLGHPWPITGTSDSGGSTTTLKDSPLLVYANDRLNGAWILLTSGSPSLTELRITDFVQSTGVATFVPTLGAAPDALTYEVMPFSGTDMLRAIQDAGLYLYDSGLLVRDVFMRLVGGSPLYNADWSYWTSSTVVDGWTVATSTLARERASNNIGLAETSVKLSTATGTLTLDARWRRFLEDKKGYTVTLYCPVKCDTASAARINLYSGSNNYSAYHGGTSTSWELLSSQVTVSETASDLYPQLVLDSASAVAYFGMPFIVGGPQVTEYPIPLVIMPNGPTQLRRGALGVKENQIASQRGLSRVRELGRQRQMSDFGLLRHHDEATTTEVGLLDFTSASRIPRAGDSLWAIGDGPLTLPTSATGADAIEVNHHESLMIATLAAIRLLERELPRVPSTLQQDYAQRIGRLQRQFNDLVGGADSSRDVAALPLRW